MNSLSLSCWLRYAAVLTLAALLAACGASTGEVAKLPDPNATVPITGAQRVVSAKVYTYQADPAAVSVTWSWGDGTPDSLGNSVQKVWNKAGIFTGKISATLNGKSVSASQTVQVVIEPVSAGETHTCAIVSDGSVQCWGFNQSGQLGNNTTTNSLTTVTVAGLSNAVGLATGLNHTCALQSSGTVSCWGENNAGQLGNGTPTAASLVPVAVQGLTNTVALAAGEKHTCALSANGAVSCWGDNFFGQLIGVSPTLSGSFVATPVVVPGVTSAVALSGADANTCALIANGGVLCWGFNGNGRLGTGVFSGSYSTPSPVTGLTDAIALTSGHGHNCALRAGGTVVCWGFNNHGELGNGLVGDRSTPVDVVSLTGVVSVTAGGYHNCALTSSGALYCWGNNNQAQLGDGTRLSRFSPTLVPGLTDTVMVTAGPNTAFQIPDNQHTCALRAGGNLSCWGSNLNGQAGTGKVSDPVLTPTSVLDGALFWR
jgi:alpha-tubulin suppressor-like RCC1 family protein